MDIAFSHNGQYIFTNGSASGIHLWDAKTKKILVHSNLGTLTTGAAFNRDDTRLAMVGEAGLELWTIYPGPRMTQDKIIRGYGDSLSNYVVIGGRDGNLAAFSEGGTQIDLYDLTTDQPLPALDNTDPIRDYTFDRTGLRLAVATINGTRVWDIETRTLLADLTDNPVTQDYNQGVAFRPDGAEIAIGRADGDIELYRITE